MVPLSANNLPRQIKFYKAKEMVLLPRTQLNLVLKKKSDIAFFESAFQEGRLMGVVQRRLDDKEAIFETGCLGRITSFSESASGKIFVVLTGISRFNILSHCGDTAHVSYDHYLHDLEENQDTFFNRDYLSSLMEEYLNEHDIAADWDEIESSSDEHLLHSLTMSCPFDPAEKQAILECANLQEQSLMITSFIEMANPRYKDKKAHYH